MVCGSDVEELERLADRIGGTADWCFALARELDRIARGLPVLWVGRRERAMRDGVIECAGIARQAARVLLEQEDEIRDHAAVQRRTSSAHDVADVASGTTSAAGGGPERTVLWIDPEGRGQIIVAHGDLETAERIVIYVPGTGSSLETAEKDLRRGDALAESVDDTTVVITWIGYESPETILPFDGWRPTDPRDSATSSASAQRAADDLAAFMETVSLAGAIPLVLIAHSYGGTVAGRAAERFGGVDTLIFAASPGVAPTIDDASDVAAKHVYSIAADDDPVALIGVFGERPDSPRFEAVRLSTGDTDLGHKVTGHSDYFERGSTSLENLARAASGDHDNIVVHEPSTAERVGNATEALFGRLDPFENRLNEAVDLLGPDHPLNAGVDLVTATRRGAEGAVRMGTEELVDFLFGD